MSCSNLLNFNFLQFHLFFQTPLKTINNHQKPFRPMFLYNVIIYMSENVSIMSLLCILFAVIKQDCFIIAERFDRKS